MAYYDSQIQPPAVFTSVQVTNPDNASAATVPAKFDTGAGMTVLPRSIIESLDFAVAGRILASGFDRVPIERPIYFAHLTVEGYSFSDIKVTVAPRNDILLGRDILNRFIITLDAKAQTVEMYDP